MGLGAGFSKVEVAERAGAIGAGVGAESGAFAAPNDSTASSRCRCGDGVRLALFRSGAARLTGGGR